MIGVVWTKRERLWKAMVCVQTSLVLWWVSSVVRDSPTLEWSPTRCVLSTSSKCEGCTTCPTRSEFSGLVHFHVFVRIVRVGKGDRNRIHTIIFILDRFTTISIIIKTDHFTISFPVIHHCATLIESTCV